MLTYAFDSTCTFSGEKCLFKFGRRVLVFHRGNDEVCDIIRTIVEGREDRDEAFKTIHKFLCCYGWENNCSFHNTGRSIRGLKEKVDLLETKPNIIIKRLYRNLLVGFGYTGNLLVGFGYTAPSNLSDELFIALSLYNDARYVNDYFYKFLCYWKILEIQYPNRLIKKAKKWINDIIAKGVNIYKDDHLKEMISNNVDIGCRG